MTRRWTILDGAIALAAFGLLAIAANRASHTGELSVAGVCIYIVLPVVMAGGLLFLLRVTALTQAKVLLSVFAAAGAILLIGLYLEWQSVRAERELKAHPVAVRARAFARIGLPFDGREPAEVVADLQKKGVAAVPYLVPAFFRDMKGVTPLPLGGVGSALTVYCNEGGTYVTFTADEHGFRNPPASYDSPADVVLIGDSFGMGYCVEESGSIAGTIRGAGMRTVNLSASGNGPLYELASLREFGASLKPRTVVWLYFAGNDLANLENEVHNRTLSEYFDPGFRQGIAERQADVDALIIRTIRNPPARNESPLTKEVLSGFVRLKSLRALLAPWLLVPRASAILPSLEKVLTLARDEVSHWDGRMVFVYLPELAAVRRPDANSTFRRDEVANLVKRLGIRFIDMADRFAQSPVPPQDPRLPPDSHYDANGYRMTAEAILEQIR